MSTRRSVTATLCRRAHACGAELGRDAAFLSTYGADTIECNAKDQPFVTQVLAHSPGDPLPYSVSHDDPANAFWRRLTNCETGLARASCGDLGAGTLLEPGEFCGDDVLSGSTSPPDDLAQGTCYTEL